MKQPLKISIAMCTFNGERFLREQLESFEAQTRLPDEVIIGDDCSTDGTLEILQNWAETVPFRVEIIQNPQNLGYEKNFENVMMRCSVDIIFPADQDDVWLPEKLERMARVFEEEPDVGVVYCGRTLIDQDGKPLSERVTELFKIYHPVDSSYFLADQAEEHPDCAGCMSAVRKSVVEKLFPFPAPWAHDTWVFTMAPFHTRMKTLKVPLMRFRRHTTNASALGREPDWANGLNVYYLTSVGQFRFHAPLAEDLRKHFAAMPDCGYKTRYLRYLDRQKRHFGRRVRVQDHFLTSFWLAFWELLRGGYFQHQQPIRSFLFDLKEGLAGLFRRADRS
ncbi:MAG: glycosyltransferase family 2 protein [Planctomycetia bacterium]|nr:glycosyltransferase family 2 protein [Planctomycetia bacterium]